MKQSEALSLAVELLERVAPGRNFKTAEFYASLRDIKSAIPPVQSDVGVIGVSLEPAMISKNSSSTYWPRTAIVCGEEFCEIDRRSIKGRNLILMQSCRDGSEAPGILVDADTHEVVLDEVVNGFRDYGVEKVPGCPAQ